ncbi:hypothetical protein [Alterisphingorhabdus coralli]|uniref:Uncharacterized protein n=1 Tax=Alterisphingorhabdus coralli TaxID=3071408 RepID=A0AA97F3W1_9SPHN|nr:hypothetical protein [Parasphingorhabdus sp. SCSIO 66989]WOE73826.1 hypothetical protein RB602_08065 [Parasphingorhabdus sp. SCSIO 66989]
MASSLHVTAKPGFATVWTEAGPRKSAYDHLMTIGTYFSDRGASVPDDTDYLTLGSDTIPITRENIVHVEDIRPFLGKFLLSVKDREVFPTHTIFILYDHAVTGEDLSDDIVNYIGVFPYEW